MIEREHVRQIFTFGVVGVSATLVHYTVALALTEALSVLLYLANIAGFMVAVLVSLFGHSLLTFRKPINKAVSLKFFFVAIGALAVSEILLVILTQHVQLHHRVALALVVVAVPAVTFILNKFWVYR